MRYLLTSAIFTVLGISPALAASKPVPFVAHNYDNPQPTQPIFVHSWPDLINEENTEPDRNMSMKPSQGHNVPLVLDIAVVPIRDGTATISMDNEMEPICSGRPTSNHDNYPHAVACPARITIMRNGKYQTLNLGKLCLALSDNPADKAYAQYEPNTNMISTYVIIAGKKVGLNEVGDHCNKTIKLPN